VSGPSILWQQSAGFHLIRDCIHRYGVARQEFYVPVKRGENDSCSYKEKQEYKGYQPVLEEIFYNTVKKHGLLIIMV
jgi:hypothetical protein